MTEYARFAEVQEDDIYHITYNSISKYKAIVNVECFWIKCKLSYTEFNCSFKFMYNAANKSD